MSAASGADAKTAGTVQRVVHLLRFLAEAGQEVTIKQTADALGLPMSTVHRLLHLLGSEGMVHHDPASRRYQVGVEMARISWLIASSRTLKDVARPFMQAIVDRCNEACLFVVHLPATHQVSLLEGINSSHPLRYEMQLYTAHSLLWGATGRSILAFLPKEEQAAALARGEPSPGTGRPAPTLEDLRKELRPFLERGYVTSRGEKVVGAFGMGAPVFRADGRVIASLCLTIPQMRAEAVDEARLASLLRRQADALSRTLGFRGTYPGGAI
ncbi:IclR family transcriptional regulator [Roseomonas sp. OT10]|uniref:IclR family transcriptional regulator n=1 Tax=Roseomonas cutis TaxID=2897332 RepID=UPI001E4C97BF|nr:IclR family transcriptional regulator [Roseomonas sp. OT10]UFN48036.1 IclR family transcriptional regulator [Roseomonas sp. OT10]